MKSPTLRRCGALFAALLVILPLSALRAAEAPAGNAVCLDRSVPSPEKPWRHQLFQNDIDLDPSADYVVTFWAKASAPTRLSISTKNSMAPWAYFGLRENIAISAAWKRYQLPFSAAKAIPGHSRLTFAFGDKDAVKIWLADVVIRLAGRDQAMDNHVRDGRFAHGLDEWYADGRQPDVFDVSVLSVAGVDAVQAAPAGK